ncbi:hypothetical protein V5799_012173 [Amblyomma americanum]|uniref:Uncharacterized protein n=1 Tax=Amblyomma americanum TaxID=6943 RepID=A0AAQ4EF50_AMBAM
MVQVPLLEAVESTSTMCERRTPSEQWTSWLTGDLANDESVADSATPAQDDELREIVASWDPSQENCYALSTPGETFQLDGLEKAVDAQLPATSYTSVVDESLAAGPLDCLSTEKTPSKTPLGRSLYEDLQWLTDESEDVLSKSSHGVCVDRPPCIRSTHPAEGPAVLAAINAVTENFTSLAALSQSTLTTEHFEDFQQSTDANGAWFPHTAAVSDVDFDCTQKWRRRSSGNSGEAKRQLVASSSTSSGKEPDVLPKGFARGYGRSADAELSGNSDKGFSNVVVPGRAPGSTSSSQTVANDHVELPCAERGAAREVRSVVEVKQSSVNSADELPRASCSAKSRREPVTRPVQSLHMTDVPEVSWNTVALKGTTGPELSSSQLEKDDVIVMRNGEINIHIRTSTRRKASMLWPFGSPSLDQSSSSSDG